MAYNGDRYRIPRHLLLCNLEKPEKIKNMKRILTLLCCVSALLMLASCGRSAKKAAEDAAIAAEIARQDSIAAVEKQQQIMEKLANLPAEPVFDIVTSEGTIRIKLYEDTPKHRDNFAKLALEGFYDGILFHRVIPGFMIQGGDPLTKDAANKQRFGTGGPGYTVPAEILPNHKHKLGALASARLGDAANPLRESSGSQFYIVVDEVTCSQLDGQYTVYGETLEGFEVAQKIAHKDTDARDCPLTEVKIEKIVLVE